MGRWERILLNDSADKIAWEKSTFNLIVSHRRVWSTSFSKVIASTKKLSAKLFRSFWGLKLKTEKLN